MHLYSVPEAGSPEAECAAGRQGIIRLHALLLLGRLHLLLFPFRFFRRVGLARPGRWTPLFFLDDAVALAAGHRPCGECRYTAYRAYRDAVLPPNVTARVAVEMASPIGWDRYVGPQGEIIGMRSFGASSPIKDLLPHFGFTSDHIVSAAKAQLAARTTSR